MANSDLHRSKELLDRFLSGDVGPKEEAELEHLANKDEALSEALAAYRLQAESDHIGALLKIKKQLPRKRIRSVYGPLSVAAAVLVLVGTAAFIWPQVQDAKVTSSSPTLADSSIPDNREQEESTYNLNTKKSKEASNTEATPSIQQQSTVAKKQQEIIESKETASAQRIEAAPRKLDNTSFPTEATAEIAAPQFEEISNVSAAATASFDTSLATSNNGRYYSKQQARSLEGYITDELGKAISQANIAPVGQAIGVQSDSNGYFTLNLDQSFKTLQIEHPDYIATKITLHKEEQSVVINLEQPSSRLDNSLETSFDGGSTTMYPNAAKTAAAPDGGMAALRNQMAAAKPEALPSGKVRVSFYVQADGKLTDFRFHKSPSQDLSDFVQYFLVSSSNWQLSGGTDPVRIITTFRL